MKIYVVYGGTCEHGDTLEWNVKAFINYGDAQQLAGQLNDWCAINGVYFYSNKPIKRANKSLSCPHDPKYTCYDFGVQYRIEELELEGI